MASQDGERLTPAEQRAIKLAVQRVSGVQLTMEQLRPLLRAVEEILDERCHEQFHRGFDVGYDAAKFTAEVD